ncbi:MAG: hypothetical protein RMA76_22995 [Deltaproteobacteria bacterium]|jgi:hypothetical protein
MKTPHHPLKYAVAGLTWLLVFFGAALVSWNLWGERRPALVVAPQIHNADFDQTRLRTASDGVAARSSADTPDTLPPPDARDVGKTRATDAASEDIGVALKDDALPSVDLERTHGDWVGVERSQTTILSDEDFRAAIADWTAPHRCARRGDDASALALALTIAPTGEVVDARPRDVDNLAERRIARCLVRRVPTLSFPRTDSDTAYEREATFVF